MTEESQFTDNNDKQSHTNQDAYKRWVVGIVIGDVIAVILLTVIGGMTTTWDTWANVIAVGLVGIGTVDAVILQVLTAGQMTVTMDRQEFEMTEQRKALQASLKLTNNIITEMQEQRGVMSGQLEAMKTQSDLVASQVDLAEDALKQTDDLLAQNERLIEATGRQAETTEKALKLSDETFYLAERAYLGLGGFSIERYQAGSPIAFKFEVPNRGRTPAFNTRISIKLMHLTHQPTPLDPDLVLRDVFAELEWVESLHSHLILPGEHSIANTAEQTPLPKDVFDQWSAGDLELWICISVKFTDIRNIGRGISHLVLYTKEGHTIVKAFPSDVPVIISNPTPRQDK